LKDEETKFEEIETSPTIGGEGEGRGPRGEGIDVTLLSCPPEMEGRDPTGSANFRVNFVKFRRRGTVKFM
jgi:hypothetical protein